MKSLFERVTEGLSRESCECYYDEVILIPDLRKRCEEIEAEGQRQHASKDKNGEWFATLARGCGDTHEVLVIPMSELKPKDERVTKEEIVRLLRSVKETRRIGWVVDELEFDMVADRIEKHGINSSGGEGI